MNIGQGLWESEDMNKDFIEAIMNPIRQRIIQYLTVHEKGSTGEIHMELSDVPKASLYRHTKTLLEVGAIEVAEEKKIRGTTEKIYKLASYSMGNNPEQEELALIIQTSLLSIMGSFQRYFAANKEVDPVKDMLAVAASTLMLTDEEFMEVLKEMGQIINKSAQNPPEPGRRMRRFTLISSPCEEGTEDVI